MNDTLNRIKARRDKAAEKRLTEMQQRAETERKRCEAAKPLFDAFNDIRHVLVKVSVLQGIWPEDYHDRDDRAQALVTDILGGPAQPYGIKFRIPGGYRRLQVEVLDDGSLNYVVIRESPGGRPYVANYRNAEQWLESFYGAMGSLLEL
ncbi:MAG TPA: hypothetical protein DDY14_06560 [Chromatiaceae bacterium]|jgi:hypothetical protein|nr:MAG: hypothetical protein N838_02405 [Thiohalocapsa sp. PB-PSB1]QQO54731.1 MAG: hypothetical protein N838_16690 [Thiohalocapsa sp. PB-PSB1]HBG94978.1 hypothetical protein [Chromatiaceae bacterium]HCS90642.1 hypothetical protein [Chromatiaceae bacterium]